MADQEFGLTGESTEVTEAICLSDSNFAVDPLLIIPLLSLSEKAIARSLMRQSIQAILLEKNRSCICY
ncbi:hypothetical protein [Nostoc sp.]|uniref:hypothetical protein n=1 Tax=Nostoc sp. TaxID=1180 RepID=UPI002FF6B879